MLRSHSPHRSIKATCEVAAYAIALIAASTYSRADSFTQIDLVSSVPNLANTTDPNLKNPWGVSFSPTSPFWVSNQGSGTATLYDGAGTPQALVVTIPPGTPPVTGPTGQVFNSTTGFLVNGVPAHFIFDTLNGTISGWAAGTSASVTATTAGAVYTGLALNTSGSSTYLYAANSTGNIHVFNSLWADVTGTTFAGKFVDPNAVAGFVPFNIQTIGSNLYVTYADLTPIGTGLPGGYVDEFDANGNFIKRIATGGALYAPWGMTLAPSGFGSYSDDLLVGNFGNGEILAYDPSTDAYLGTIDGTDSLPLVNPFLWSLETRTGGTNANLDAVYLQLASTTSRTGYLEKLTQLYLNPQQFSEQHSACSHSY
ncbi:TIGR03118 family protein [Edaphobacter paludis]|uniref:TIGR03118 family protein n=1 Tax=Edaphobacter paludis TaxID=3035702 RepID=A0AAU7D322_9BACT